MNALVGTSVEFVCNLPGPVEEVVALVRDTGPVTSGVYPRLFATVEATGWTPVGSNYVGPPFGNHVAGDVGVYVWSESTGPNKNGRYPCKANKGDLL